MSSKEELIAAAQAVAAGRGARNIGMSEFRRATGIGPDRIYRDFASWRELCEAAGLEPVEWKTRIADDAVFEAMRDGFLACGGIVTRTQFAGAFRYSTAVLVNRFRSWPDALAEFGAWSRVNAPDFPYFDQLARRLAVRPVARPRRSSAPPRPPWRSKGARPCGEVLRFRALVHAPTNEGGVVLAFGMVAEDLGYAIETVEQSFPDCVAKRIVGAGRWETVRIEFEYRSRNFHHHAHDPKGCDVVVCWEHDWPDCPVEVLDLKSAIEGLRARPPRRAAAG